MELFYTNDINDSQAVLTEDEYRHCCKVLRHRCGDTVKIIDGRGGLYDGELIDITSSRATAQIRRVSDRFGEIPYRLHMAVAPTKNIDRFEWFLEKSIEMGISSCTPVICQHSERKIVKTERLDRIALSAIKQSLKGTLPEIPDACSFNELIRRYAGFQGLKVICYCSDEYEKKQYAELVNAEKDKIRQHGAVVLIGPEGDFDTEEVKTAIEAGFIPVALGSSRLRTETAALFAVAGIYFTFSQDPDHQ